MSSLRVGGHEILLFSGRVVWSEPQPECAWGGREMTQKNHYHCVKGLECAH